MTAMEGATLKLDVMVRLRLAEKQDLPKIEWFGQYRHYRNLFRRAYREQLRGKRLMLIADYNGFPIGHIFIQLTSTNSRIADGNRRAYFYSLRVMEMFRGQGLGTWLLTEAEALILSRGYQTVTIAAAKENHGALRLYERLGYHKFAEDPGRWQYLDHRGKTRYVDEPCWLLEKSLKLG